MQNLQWNLVRSTNSYINPVAISYKIEVEVEYKSKGEGVSEMIGLQQQLQRMQWQGKDNNSETLSKGQRRG